MFPWVGGLPRLGGHSGALCAGLGGGFYTVSDEIAEPHSDERGTLAKL